MTRFSRLMASIAPLSAVIVFATAQPAFAQPASLIEEIYQAYATSPAGVSNMPDQYNTRWYSARINRMIAALNDECKNRDDICGPDFDFLVDAQDYEIKNVKVREISRTGRRAVVEAKFDNLGEARTMTFTLVEENGRWVIDELLGKSPSPSPGYRLTELLKQR